MALKIVWADLPGRSSQNFKDGQLVDQLMEALQTGSIDPLIRIPPLFSDCDSIFMSDFERRVTRRMKAAAQEAEVNLIKIEAAMKAVKEKEDALKKAAQSSSKSSTRRSATKRYST